MFKMECVLCCLPHRLWCSLTADTNWIWVCMWFMW